MSTHARVTGPVPGLVIGLGSLDRGDDAVGPEVARAVAAGRPAGVRVLEQEDPTAMLDLWPGHDLVVIVDAVRSGDPVGTVHLLETGAAGPPLTERAWSATGRGGTHAFGLAAAVELARALHRLPPRLIVVGVETAGFEYGAALEPRVAAAVPVAAARVLSVFEEERDRVPR